MLLTNRAPVGALELARYGVIEHGGTFAVRPEDVAGLIGQVENYDAADEEAAAAREAYFAALEPVVEIDDPQEIEAG